MKKTILIITNQLTHEGGVVNYYNLFFRYFHSESYELKHFTIGSRTTWFYNPILKVVLYPITYFLDLFKYCLLLKRNIKCSIVQINPSLIPVPLIRDSLFIIIGQLFKKKIIVFFRGWNTITLNSIENSRIASYLFRKIYLSPNHTIFVLAKSFKESLVALGCNPNKIKITTTAIDRLSIIQNNISIKLPLKVLYLSRLQPEKGVEELIEAAYLLIKQSGPSNFVFTIAGHEFKKGYFLELKKNIEKKLMPDNLLNLVGRKEGPDKYSLYSQNDIFILPSYSEGCPNSVLEALSSGMYCITTDVGALKDVILPGFNGEFVNSKDVTSIVDVLNSLPSKIEDIRASREIISFDSISKIRYTPNYRIFCPNL